MESPYPALVIFLMVKVTVFQPLGYDFEARGTILNDCMYPHHRVFSVYIAVMGHRFNQTENSTSATISYPSRTFVILCLVQRYDISLHRGKGLKVL